MIVAMKHVDIVCLASDGEATLAALRDLGAVHLDLGAASGEEVAAAKGDIADAEAAARLILKMRGKARRDSLDIRPREVREVLALGADRDTLRSEQERLEREIRAYEPYGDFDPALAQKLLDRGIDIKDRLPARLPEMRLSKMREKLERVLNRIRIDEAKLASSDEEAVLRRFPELTDRVAFAAARELLADRGAVRVVSGWIPAPRVADLRAHVSKMGWGILVRDPAAGESPPTLIEPPKLFRPVKVLFSGLGIAPAYTESDVSVPFMCYFSLFFAMLVGDGGYGAVILAGALAGWRKYRAETRSNALLRSWLVLLTVFSTATIAWGILSNTWFGAGLPFAKDWPTVRWLGDPTYGNMMFLCFTIGASHLVLARLWSGLCMLNDRACLAQFGWAGVVVFMYLVTNAIVGIFPGIPPWAYWMFGASLVLVFGFTLKGSELKSRGIELGMLPLNIMSALGDIISYVRLFAVGLASVKVAQNFNEMAVGLDLPIWLKVVPMVLILLVGHGLNFAMAGLSILVHAVRLNTLEFSNHKGVTWAGYAFSPFKKH